MSYYEYRVVAAPKEVPKVKGVRGSAARFALAMEASLNEEGAAGWEFQRSETQVVETRQGLFRKSVIETITVHVYRRWVDTVAPQDSATWQQRQDSAPPQPEVAPSRGAEADARAPDATAHDTRGRQAPGLSAQRRPDGLLRPVPGAARD